MTDQESSNDTTGQSGGRPRGRRFKTSLVVLATFAALGGAWVVGAALHAQPWERPGIHAARYGGWHHDRSPGGMVEWLCSDRRGDWLEDRIGAVESFVTFTPEQEPAWQALTAAGRSGSERMGEACGSIEATDGAQPTARLARAEVMLEAGLEVVRTVRPAFDDFYAVLDEEQKAALDRLMTRRDHD